MKKKNKKDASLDALFNESKTPAIIEKNEAKPTKKTVNNKKAQSRGRPAKVIGERQQVLCSLPDPVYFKMLDWVNLQKRSERGYSMNQLINEALDLWLTDKAIPSIKELTNK